jgi:hypothetical protein
LLTSLFLATALSISSVKIVAAVLREVDYLRRNLGQVILAAAILDDTIGWTILAFIGGLAAQGRIVIGPVLFSVLGTAAFVAFCFTIGRRWVARIIRWTNDHFVIEMPVISVILAIMIGLALVTNFIGVHTVLGAFAAGIMALARVPMRDEEKARLEREAAEEKDFVPKLERVLVGLDGGDNGRLASRLAGCLIGARHLTATVMEVDSAAKNSEPPSSPSQEVIDAAETAAYAAEAKDNPPKDDARDPIDVAVEGAKSERIPVRELVSILPLKAHNDTTASAYVVNPGRSEERL